MEPLLLTPKEAARALGLSQSYLYELLSSDTLPSITIGRTRRITRRALEEFVVARATEEERYLPLTEGRRRGGEAAAP